MSFKDEILADLPIFFSDDEFAESAIYTPADDDFDGVVTGCNVLIDFESTLRPSSLDSQVLEIGITITALCNVIGEPRSGSTFEISGNTYTVKRIESNDKTTVVMWVTENES